MARKKIPEKERLKLWVRAGGRCQLCNRYLLDGQMAYRELTFGQAAHIVGQQASAGSPRGCQGPVELPQGRSRVVPAGGHQISPLVATRTSPVRVW